MLCCRHNGDQSPNEQHEQPAVTGFHVSKHGYIFAHNTAGLTVTGYINRAHFREQVTHEIVITRMTFY